MRKAKISTNFVPLTDADFGEKVSFILQSMEGNPYFTTPIPTLQSIRNLLDEYKAALLAAIEGSKTQIALKKQLRKTIEHELSLLALYVMFTADGDETILVSSGFNLTKTPERQYISKPGNVKLCNGITSGQLISSIKAVKGAKCYIHEIAPDPVNDNSTWSANGSSRCSFTFTDLRPGQLYWIRVAAVGTGKQKAYSEPAYQWAQ